MFEVVVEEQNKPVEEEILTQTNLNKHETKVSSPSKGLKLKNLPIIAEEVSQSTPRVNV